MIKKKKDNNLPIPAEMQAKVNRLNELMFYPDSLTGTEEAELINLCFDIIKDHPIVETKNTAADVLFDMSCLILISERTQEFLKLNKGLPPRVKKVLNKIVNPAVLT
jgi:hypothetical protein